MAVKKNQQVDIIDLTAEPYEPNDIKAKIISKYGITGDFNYIYLKRYDANKQLRQVDKYSDLPDEHTVMEQHGGGNYELWIYFDDPNTASGKNLTKVPLLIEGTPIIKDHTGNSNKLPQDPDAAEDKMLDKLAKYKVIFGGAGNQENGKIDLVIKQMEMQNNMILKLIESIGKGSGNSKLEEILLTKAFEKNSSELDIFLKAKKIWESGAPTADENAWLKALAPALVPIVGKLLGPRQPVAGVNGSAAAAGMIEAGPDNPLIAAINNMAAAVNNIDTRIAALELKVNDIQDGIEPIPDDEDPGNDQQNYPGDDQPGELQIINSTGEAPAEEIDPNDPLLAIADQIRNASEAEQLDLLKQWVTNTSAKETYDFCLRYKLVKDLNEFNNKMKSAGLAELKL